MLKEARNGGEQRLHGRISGIGSGRQRRDGSRSGSRGKERGLQRAKDCFSKDPRERNRRTMGAWTPRKISMERVKKARQASKANVASRKSDLH